MEYKREEAIRQMNKMGKMGQPFLFIIDYEMKHNHLIPLDKVNPDKILFDFNGFTNLREGETDCLLPNPIIWEKEPVSFESYRKGFDIVLEGLRKGNSFLTNLTGRTAIQTNLTLEQIFKASQAKYRLWMNGHFCALSPEIFIQIRDGRIASFPMKGTIDATLPNAEQQILNDPKEMAEHATIVDLIRNDVSMHAEEVTVKRFRYIDRLKTNEKDLLQVSSEIEGKLPENYAERLGSILYDMLPAGSICGAPKKKTCEIIRQAEGIARGYYTGIAGIFDGKNLDSGVLIRFIEQNEQGSLFFRSGGGITAKSDSQLEYAELIQKIYVPLC